MAALHGKVQRGIMQEIGLLEGENNKDYFLSRLIRGRRIRISHFQEGDPDGSYGFSPFPSIRIRISVKNERNSSILAGPKRRQAPTRRTETFSNCTRLPSFRKTVPHFFTRLDIWPSHDLCRRRFARFWAKKSRGLKSLTVDCRVWCNKWLLSMLHVDNNHYYSNKNCFMAVF